MPTAVPNRFTLAALQTVPSYFVMAIVVGISLYVMRQLSIRAVRQKANARLGLTTPQLYLTQVKVM
jgi:hypothetical protein